MVDYGLKANEICGTLTAATAGNPKTAAGLQKNATALDTALNGLEQLVPPTTIQTIYLDMVTKFKAAEEIFKMNLPQIIQLSQKLNANPNDTAAQKKLNNFEGPVGSDLSAAATDAHKLGLGRCEVAFGGAASG